MSVIAEEQTATMGTDTSEAVSAGYKRTDAGVIPEDWEVERFGDLCSVVRGGSPRPIQKYITNSADGINWIKIGDVGVGAKYIDATAEKIVPAGATRSRNVKVGDFLLSNSMSFGRPYILRTEGCVHDGWLVIQDYHAKFDTEYLYYYLSTETVLTQYARYAAGSSVLNLNKELVSSISVAVPAPAEQRAIAEALSDVDGLLGALEALIAKKRSIKQAAMQQLLTGQTRLPGFSGEWEVKRLGEVASIRNQKVMPANVDPDTQCIELEHIGQADGRLLDHSNARNSTSAKYRFSAGDVLFGRLRSYLRKYWLADRDGICTTEIWPLMVAPEKTDSGFLLAIVQSDRFIETASISYGTHMPRADWSVMRNFEVQLPGIAEQTAIATVLSDMDAEITALEARRDKTRAIKQGMMQQLLTGRVRLVEPEVAA